MIVDNCKRFAQSAGPGLNTIWLITFGGFVWIHFLCFSNGLSSVFKHRFWLRHEITFGALFIFGAVFEAFFSAFSVQFSIILARFSFLGALWERWGPTFSSQKRFGPPKAPQEAFPPNPLIFLDPFWSHFFWFFLFFWALFLSIVFCWVLRPIFHGFWLHFDTIFWYCFVLVGTSGFCDFWKPFYSKTRFLQVRGYQM